MFNPRKILSRFWFPILLLSALALVVACGEAATEPAPTATSAPQATAEPQPTAMPDATAPPDATEPPAQQQPTTPAQQPTVAPTSTPMPAPTRVVETTHKPEGVMNYGVAETGNFEGHPRFMSSPRVQYSATSFGESLVTIQDDLSPGPLLAASWEISSDSRVWTFHIRDDVEFHHKCGASGTESCGNLTAEDILWNYRQYYEGALLARAGIIGDFWSDKSNATQEIVDEHTVTIDGGRPWLQQQVFEYMRHLGGTSTSIASMQQTREKVEAAGGSMDDTSTPEYEAGAREASRNISATGPWVIDSHESGEVWRFKAVENHWRQTPYFAEFNMWSIPEEAARVAGFQTGRLDIMEMSFDALPTVEAVDGAVIVSWPYGGQVGLNIYGQTYVPGTDRNEHLDCNNAWVSCDPDPASDEWQNAVKVKKAMAVAIDRQALVDTFLSGLGQVLYLRDWMGHEAKADPRWVHEYDPEMAKQLLAEAGYGPGNEFSITLVPAIRGAPAEVETCEAVGQYWQAVGIEVDLQRVPYQTIRPELINAIYQGATCHSVGQRLTPAIGASNYVANSTFSYGTEHPWMEEHITDLLQETDPVQVTEKERKVYGWFYDNVMAFALYSYDGVWPVGARLDPEWTPIDFSETKSPSAFEYIKHRQ